MATRTSRINALRGCCREFGLAIGVGSRLGMERIGRALVDPDSSHQNLTDNAYEHVPSREEGKPAKPSS